MHTPLEGTLEEHVFSSEVLADNLLDDPAERPLLIYLPPGYHDDDRRYPSIYVLIGYTGQATMWTNRSPWRPTFPEAADELFASGAAPPCILVFVDAWTRYGGSQYVDSPGTGRYHTYLCDEIVPWVDDHYRTLPNRDHRGVQGKSSGGFGAMITPMLRPDLFGGLASHAGDALYEFCYIPGFADAARALRDEYDGSYQAFIDDFFSRPAMRKEHDDNLILTYGVAACFSADDDGTVHLPFDVGTGQLIPDVWRRWLNWDPVRMVARHTDALRSQRAIWLDAGKKDEWYLDLGMQAFVAELEAIGIIDVHHELFDAKHGGIDYRYPLSLSYLAHRLSA
ncbi:MAG: enterochelin esterase [Actinobacteria bacterium]|nr:enterochelin esterase [Actinomycetota bacterium]